MLDSSYPLIPACSALVIGHDLISGLSRGDVSCTFHSPPTAGSLITVGDSARRLERMSVTFAIRGFGDIEAAVLM